MHPETPSVSVPDLKSTPCYSNVPKVSECDKRSILLSSTRKNGGLLRQRPMFSGSAETTKKSKMELLGDMLFKSKDFSRLIGTSGFSFADYLSGCSSDITTIPISEQRNLLDEFLFTELSFGSSRMSGIRKRKRVELPSPQRKCNRSEGSGVEASACCTSRTAISVPITVVDITSGTTHTYMESPSSKDVFGCTDLCPIDVGHPNQKQKPLGQVTSSLAPAGEAETMGITAARRKIKCEGSEGFTVPSSIGRQAIMRPSRRSEMESTSPILAKNGVACAENNACRLSAGNAKSGLTVSQLVPSTKLNYKPPTEYFHEEPNVYNLLPRLALEGVARRSRLRYTQAHMRALRHDRRNSALDPFNFSKNFAPLFLQFPIRRRISKKKRKKNSGPQQGLVTHIASRSDKLSSPSRPIRQSGQLQLVQAVSTAVRLSKSVSATNRPPSQSKILSTQQAPRFRLPRRAPLQCREVGASHPAYLPEGLWTQVTPVRCPSRTEHVIASGSVHAARNGVSRSVSEGPICEALPSNVQRAPLNPSGNPLVLEDLRLSSSVTAALRSKGMLLHPTPRQLGGIEAWRGGGDLVLTVHEGRAQRELLAAVLAEVGAASNPGAVGALVLTSSRTVALKLGKAVEQLLSIALGTLESGRISCVYLTAPKSAFDPSKLLRSARVVVAIPQHLGSVLQRAELDLRRVRLLVLDRSHGASARGLGPDDRALGTECGNVTQAVLDRVPRTRQTISLELPFVRLANVNLSAFVRHPQVVPLDDSSAPENSSRVALFFRTREAVDWSGAGDVIVRAESGPKREAVISALVASVARGAPTGQPSVLVLCHKRSTATRLGTLVCDQLAGVAGESGDRQDRKVTLLLGGMVQNCSERLKCARAAVGTPVCVAAVMQQQQVLGQGVQLVVFDDADELFRGFSEKGSAGGELQRGLKTILKRMSQIRRTVGFSANYRDESVAKMWGVMRTPQLVHLKLP